MSFIKVFRNCHNIHICKCLCTKINFLIRLYILFIFIKVNITWIIRILYERVTFMFLWVPANIWYVKWLLPGDPLTVTGYSQSQHCRIERAALKWKSSKVNSPLANLLVWSNHVAYHGPLCFWWDPLQKTDEGPPISGDSLRANSLTLSWNGLIKVRKMWSTVDPLSSREA